MNVIIQLFMYDFAMCKTQWELERKQLRLQEYAICLLHNCMNKSVKSIHIFVDTEYARRFYSEFTKQFDTKATFVLHEKQPTFKDLVEYAMKTFSNDELVCIMNSDIVFNSEKDNLLIQKIAKPKRLISLTRHELTDEKHTICNPQTCAFIGWGGSSDVFIFTMPIDPRFNLDSIDHKQNMFGAENVFHKAWVDCGYEIVNPCDDIIIVHIHKDRLHFETYDRIDKEGGSNAYYNLKTKLPTDS